MVIYESRNAALLYVKIVMLASVVIGLYARLKGFGTRPLAVDEYYIAKSIDNIVNFGLPKFSCGGYYTRGLLYQYLTFPIIEIVKNKELSLRFIPLISNILCIYPLYRLSKKIGGSLVAYFSITLFCLSIWEIEFSRFARMYSPFQLLFMVYLLNLYDLVVENNRSSERWMHIISIVSIFIYEGGILLCVLNFFPIIVRAYGRRDIILLVSKLGIILFGYHYLSFNFRRLGVSNYLPNDYLDTAVKSSSLLLPNPVIISAIKTNAIMFALIIFVISIIIGYLWLKNDNDSFMVDFSIFSIISFISMCGLVGLSIAIIVLLLFFNRVNTIRFFCTKRTIIFILPVVILFSLFWTIYAYLYQIHFLSFLGESELNLRTIAVAILKYPDVFESIIYPWLYTLPKATIFFVLSFAIAISIQLYRKRNNDELLLLSCVALILMLMISVLNTPYHTTRYVFFLYPVMLLIFCWSINAICEEVISRSEMVVPCSVAILFLFLILSEDISAKHLISIDQPNVTYRIDYSKRVQKHYYHRLDYRTPAQIVNRESSINDLVISMAEPSDYYLNKIDYFYMNWDSKRFRGRACNNGNREIWTNAGFIYTEESIIRMLGNNERTIWFIYLNTKKNQNPVLSKFVSSELNGSLRYTSIDGKIELYKIIAR